MTIVESSGCGHDRTQSDDRSPNGTYEPWSEANIKKVVELWKLTAKDEQRLRDFQRRVSDVKHEWNDPHVLLRHMFGPAGYRHAEKLFREMIQWRLKNNVDTIMQDYKPHPLLMDYTPIAFLKDYDRDGDPIYVERGGAIDAQGLLKRFSKEELDRHAIWLREVQSQGAWVDEYERRQRRCIKDITVVYDLKGLSSRHLNPRVLGWFQGHMDMTDRFYPGPIKRMIIIRAPKIFQLIWAVARHFFPQSARDKMIFTGPDNYLEVLEQYMNLNVLPPCIYPQGEGVTAEGMPKRMEGGRIPDYVGYGGSGYTPDQNGSKRSSTSETLNRSTTCSVASTNEKTAVDSFTEEGVEASLFPINGKWEEIYDVNQHMHIVWEGKTGVEITNMEFLSQRNFIFI